MLQSMGACPAVVRASLVRLNGRLPKKPRYALNGDGCADSITTWRSMSISAFFARDGVPHSTKTTGPGLSLTTRRMESVNCSQP